jgi:hypothetical protein
MRTVMHVNLADGKLDATVLNDFRYLMCRLCSSAFWGFRRHFMDMADQLYGSLDSATQRSIEKERDVIGTNGTNSMSASLRGSNSSLNSMPGGVISTFIVGMRFACFLS